MKTAADTASLASEAAWLTRHPSAPAVLDVDANAGVLVLAHVAGAILATDPPPFDVAREARWLSIAAAATGPAHPADADVRDRYHHAYDGVAGRVAAREWRRDLAAEWVAWADTLDGSAWGSVPLDVILKNTIVDDDGTWWAIDPLCARAPVDALWCPWTIDRCIHPAFATTTAAVLDTQNELLAAAPHPERSADWMPGALLWTLWWAHQGHDRHLLVLDLIDHWLGRWAARHLAAAA